MKEILKNIFIPNKIIGFILFNVSFGLLIYVFSFHLEETPLAYISYLLSTYGLIIFCIWFYKICKFSNKALKKSNLYHLYKRHELLITKIILTLSIILNFLYGIFKLVTGIYYISWCYFSVSCKVFSIFSTLIIYFSVLNFLS